MSKYDKLSNSWGNSGAELHPICLVACAHAARVIQRDKYKYRSKQKRYPVPSTTTSKEGSRESDRGREAYTGIVVFYLFMRIFKLA
jgi:hypothetical protein